MRCLCLADVLRAEGTSVRFVSRSLPDHLARMIESHGHTVSGLPEGSPRDERLDADQTIAAVDSPDWVVVDHYNLAATWETAVRRNSRVLAIDDLARTHACDVLLDQNFHPDGVRRYAGLVPMECKLLIGPHHALLRPEFAQARPSVAARDGDVRQVLVFLGGMDADNVTEQALLALQQTAGDEVAVDVVIGATHPALERLQAMCAEQHQFRCHVQTSDMAGLLARADLAVGAGGSATWERCALGVPTLGLCLADNQREVLRHGGRNGFVYAPDLAANDAPSIAVHLRALFGNSGLRHHLSRTGLELVDGRGAQRVAAALLSRDITMRNALRDDAQRLHAWRNDPAVRRVSHDPTEISLAEHLRWFEGVLGSPSRHLLIGERAGTPIGVVRFDADGTSALVSIYLAPERIGHGDGAALLQAAETWLKREQPHIRLLTAQVRAGNAASHRLFAQSGYNPKSTEYTKGL